MTELVVKTDAAILKKFKRHVSITAPATEEKSPARPRSQRSRTVPRPGAATQRGVSNRQRPELFRARPILDEPAATHKPL
jgi:hypothetical protein